jgi:hypothetical protein
VSLGKVSLGEVSRARHARQARKISGLGVCCTARPKVAEFRVLILKLSS